MTVVDNSTYSTNTKLIKLHICNVHRDVQESPFAVLTMQIVTSRRRTLLHENVHFYLFILFTLYYIAISYVCLKNLENVIQVKSDAVISIHAG